VRRDDGNVGTHQSIGCSELVGEASWPFACRVLGSIELSSARVRMRTIGGSWNRGCWYSHECTLTLVRPIPIHEPCIPRRPYYTRAPSRSALGLGETTMVMVVAGLVLTPSSYEYPARRIGAAARDRIQRSQAAYMYVHTYRNARTNTR